MLQNLDSPDAKERVRLQSRLSGILLDEYAAQKKSNAGEGGGAIRSKKSCNNIYLQHIQLYRLPSCNFETVLGLMAQPAIYSANRGKESYFRSKCTARVKSVFRSDYSAVGVPSSYVCGVAEIIDEGRISRYS